MQQNNPALQRANTNWGSSSILDAAGNRMHVESAQYENGANRNSGGSGGGNDLIAKVTLEEKVKGLTIVVGVLATAFGAAFLFMINRIDNVSDKVTDVRVAVGQQSVTLAAAAESMARIEGKISDQTMPKPVEDAPVRQSK